MHSATPFNIFRLLVPATSDTASNAPKIELDGSPWTLTDETPLAVGNIPEYTCLSYSWGTGRTRNPFAPDRTMSDRVIPVLETTIRTTHPAAIWVDAFCFPNQEPERTACLRSMGAVYASASRVIAILSKSCSALLDEVVRSKYLDEAGLLHLEQDEWVGRAWTYQELVNSKSFGFVAEGGGAFLSGMQFLSEIGTALEKYKKAHCCDSFVLRTLHPRLDNLEDSIADWLTADYSKRSAYQAMSSMDRRTSEKPEDYFNALIGAFTTEPLNIRYDTNLHPAEYFMQLCEEKGDFSFIYSSAPRSTAPGRAWRPIAGRIPAIQPWHTFGDGQSGRLDSSSLRLDNMCRMTRGKISSTADEFVTKWLQNNTPDLTPGSTPDHILARLRQVGFTGCGDFIELHDGYFFPQSGITGIDDISIFVAAGVRWTHGGPGLLATQDATGLYPFGCNRSPARKHSVNPYLRQIHLVRELFMRVLLPTRVSPGSWVIPLDRDGFPTNCPLSPSGALPTPEVVPPKHSTAETLSRHPVHDHHGSHNFPDTPSATIVG